MNFIWESWLKVKTNNKQEAIINKSQSKTLLEYQSLMTSAFSEFYRVLKPGRWMTVEFHNSLNAVWNAIQEALQRVGFVIADVRTLDKKQGTFKQMTSVAAVKQDLVISAYKPKESFKHKIMINAGSEETAWDFVWQHLEKIPVVVIASGRIEIIAERQAFLLFDRMVAYHIMNGIPVPIDATEFCNNLPPRFPPLDAAEFRTEILTLPTVNDLVTIPADRRIQLLRLCFPQAGRSEPFASTNRLYGIERQSKLPANKAVRIIFPPQSGNLF